MAEGVMAEGVMAGLGPGLPTFAALPRQMLPKCFTLKFLVPPPSLLNIFVHRSLVASVEKRHVCRLRRPHRVGRQ
jgi:hypothetical protein